MARTKGSINRSTEQVRRAVSELLEMSAPKMAGWLEIVAEGKSYKEDDGSVTWLVKPEPAKAVDLVLKAAEYHIPKLARTEHTGLDGGPIKVQASEMSDDDLASIAGGK